MVTLCCLITGSFRFRLVSSLLRGSRLVWLRLLFFEWSSKYFCRYFVSEKGTVS